MQEINLSQGKVAIVDDDDYDAVTSYGRWTALKIGHTFYGRYDKREGGKMIIIYLHTFLTGWAMVDHKNGDGLDNRRSNLRLTTKSLNGANAKLRVDNTSGFKGVSMRPSGRWKASISAAGATIGTFDTIEEAAQAYDRAAVERYGEFARLNFPLIGEQA